MRPTATSLAPFAAAVAIATLATPATTALAQPQDAHSPTPPHQRSPDTRDAAESRKAPNATTPTADDLRSPDTRDTAERRASRTALTPVFEHYLRPIDLRDAATYSSAAHVTGRVPEVTRAGGFDWGDAAIGAGGATGLLAISLGGAMTLRRRHSDPRSRTALS